VDSSKQLDSASSPENINPPNQLNLNNGKKSSVLRISKYYIILICIGVGNSIVLTLQKVVTKTGHSSSKIYNKEEIIHNRVCITDQSSNSLHFMLPKIAHTSTTRELKLTTQTYLNRHDHFAQQEHFFLPTSLKTTITSKYY